MQRFLLFVLVASLIYWLAPVSNGMAQTPPDTPVAATSYVSAPTRALKVAFIQTDPSWNEVRVGNGTLGTQGCLIVSIATATGINPRTLTHTLTKAGLIRKRDGRLTTSSLSRVLPFSVTSLPMPSGTRALEVVDAELLLGKLVLIELDHGASGRKGEHWVLATARSGNDLVVADPARGMGSLIGFYGRLGIRRILVLSPVLSA